MREIKVGGGAVALVDDEDYSSVSGYKWRELKKSHKGKDYTSYAISFDGTTSKRKTILMHRIIMCAGRGEEVDHINRDGLDNRRANLRIVTHSENLKNRDNSRMHLNFRQANSV